MDPLALFRGDKQLDSKVLKKLGKDAKQVPIPYLGSSGKVHPQNSKTVWPFVCPTKS